MISTLSLTTVVLGLEAILIPRYPEALIDVQVSDPKVLLRSDRNLGPRCKVITLAKTHGVRTLFLRSVPI